MPVSDISKYYTGKTIEEDGVVFFILNTESLIDKFGDNEHATRGIKTTPTKIRKAKVGEQVNTYIKKDGKYFKESHIVAKEGDYIFQNMNNIYDTYIPQNKKILHEYDLCKDISEEFQLFSRKKRPVKLLHSIIQKPTIINIKSRGNFEQRLFEGATLKLEEDSNGLLEVVGINEGGFSVWSIYGK